MDPRGVIGLRTSQYCQLLIDPVGVLAQCPTSFLWKRLPSGWELARMNLVEMRSRGDIFGYRDGASWKFKPEEIERVASELMGDALDDRPSGFFDFG